MDLPERGAVRTGTRGAVSRQHNHLPIVAGSAHLTVVTNCVVAAVLMVSISVEERSNGKQSDMTLTREQLFNQLCFTSASILQ